MNPNDQTSLNRLYEQRKQQHKAPEHLHASLLSRAPKKPHRSRWTLALPGIAASLLVVMIVWPARQPNELMLTSMSSDAMSESALYEDIPNPVATQMAKTAPEVTLNKSREAHVTQSTFASQPSETGVVTQAETAERGAVAKPAAAPAMVPLMAEEADVYADMLADDEQIASIPMTDSLAINKTVEKEETLWLQVVDGQTGSFKNCAGEPLLLDVETDFKPGVWVQANQAKQGEWLFEALEASPCAQ